MKKTILILCVAVLLVAVLLCAVSCNLKEDGARAEALCREMTDAILADDEDAAYRLVSDTMDRETFAAGFHALREALSGIDGAYELRQTAFRSEIDNGTSSYSATYEISSGGTTVTVEVAMTEGYEGLTRYSASYSTSADAVGALTTVGEFNLLQWALLIASALFIAFEVLMVLDCVKRTLNAKALWIILILLGHLKIYANTVAEGLSAGFRIGALLPYSRLLLYDGGAFDFTLVLPVGAIVYFFLRKWLTAKYEAPVKPAALEGETGVSDEESGENPVAPLSEETPREDKDK